MALADALRAGEGDEIWELDATDYRQAVERVFDFDAGLGIDFLDALAHGYDIDIVEIVRPDLPASWEKHLDARDAETGDALVAGDNAAASGPEPPGEGHCPTLPEIADPIAAALEKMEIQSVEASGKSGGLMQARARGERRRVARAYTIRYARTHLQLPTGRHHISRDGQSGDDYWVEFQG